MLMMHAVNCVGVSRGDVQYLNTPEENPRQLQLSTEKHVLLSWFGDANRLVQFTSSRWKSSRSNSSKMSKWKTSIFLLCAAAVGLLLKSHFNNRPSSKHRDLSWGELEAELSDVDALLSHHLRHSVEPFLSANMSLSEETFYWWKQLQREKLDLNCYKSTVQKLFETFPPTSKVSRANPVRYRTCAVVGNSVNLKGAAYGHLIDFHEVIIRMNGAPIQGHEEDVGVKTTHHVMYPESAVDLNNSTHLVLIPFKIQDLEWLIKAFTTGFKGTSYVKIKSKIKANKDLVKVINPAFMKYVHEIWLKKKGSYPSTGFMALVLALHICDDVRVFGYGADSDGNWSHYWETLEDKKLKTGLHPGQHEYTLILHLANGQKLKLYKGRKLALIT